MKENTSQNSKLVESVKRRVLKDGGNVESALVLIPLIILFTGTMQLYAFHNTKSSLELLVAGIAQSSISIRSTVAAQIAAEEYFKKPGLPKFANLESLKVEVKDEQVSGFVIRKVYLRDKRYSNLINLIPLQISTTVILNR